MRQQAVNIQQLVLAEHPQVPALEKPFDFMTVSLRHNLKHLLVRFHVIPGRTEHLTASFVISCFVSSRHGDEPSPVFFSRLPTEAADTLQALRFPFGGRRSTPRSRPPHSALSHAIIVTLEFLWFNQELLQTLRKKGFNGCNSPEPDGDDSIDQSPLNEDKYRKTEDLDSLFKRYGSTVPQPTFSMPVTVPVSNQNAAAAAALQFSNNPGGALVTTTSFVTSTLTDPRLLSPQQPALQRNTVSPGLPQRPASAGALLGDLGNSNGACPSPVPNGYISARASPGLLSVSNGNSLGKVVPAKSPPPPSPQMVNSRKPDLRVITSQSGKSLMQLVRKKHNYGSHTGTKSSQGTG
ncbi:myocyte-specific enhancer factor 2D homolog [Scomber scombrus]|uniref:myocyte-specific enhancer factor 2D homolog n=1 Tax=Scomber scombrus TaxID=13677 RepID=UPI002DDBF25A|nr:myocyte-specific enhancer factor 2D homolog [Scomber scombrus]